MTHVYESGECKLAMYTQFDSHFRSLGVDLLGFVSNPKNLKLPREVLPRCDPVTSETMRAWFNAHLRTVRTMITSMRIPASCTVARCRS